MPFTSGIYAAPLNSWNPAVAASAVNATDWVALLTDLTTALSTVVLKDGTQVLTANIPMGGFKLTGLAAGSVAGDSLRFEQAALLSTYTTAGDIVQAAGAGAVARLGIGTLGQVPAVNVGATALTYISGLQVLAKSAVAVSAPADVTEDTLATITVPANAMGANGALRITTLWSFTSSGNTKTLRVRFSGGAGTLYFTPILTVNTNVECVVNIANRNTTNSQVGGSLATSDNAALGTTKATSAVDTTAGTTIVITGQKASAGETLTLESYLVELMPG